jgi:hypothetical protein
MLVISCTDTAAALLFAPVVSHDFVTGEALKANITTLGPLVLPFSEQLLFAANMVARRLLGRKRVKPYVPDFTTAFDHICIHTGGRGVIDEIEKHLRLNAKIIEPSRAALFRWVICAVRRQGLRGGQVVMTRYGGADD